MATEQDRIAELIRKDHADRVIEDWKGDFLGYLEKVRADPSVCRLGHAHLYDVIINAGVGEADDSDASRRTRLWGGEPPKVYNFFKDEFFGIEEVLEKIVHYFHAAALKGEESRQVLYLMGPVGAGKSSLVEGLKEGLEAADPIYVIDGCPIREEPLHLIPRRLRREFEKMLDATIEGELCPVCRYRLPRGLGGGDEARLLNHTTFAPDEHP